ncbi:hypothetical protein [Skermania piniformis]|uniref:Uncharacterized protein n=1 Tax=Skermania pinensis TaxID=39122 RepID=A0ABX8SCU8_9ACTN|nr:hypothetical protein [Skermania piniformis]QXQ14777.1 hypothetical protein KV203_05165 [Skermania piniformis]
MGTAGTQHQDYAFDALSRTNMKPGDYAQAPLVLRNSGNIRLSYRLQSVAQPSSTLALNLTVSGVAAEANCPTTGSPVGATTFYDGPVVGAQAPAAPALRSLVPGGSEVWCMRATVAPTAVSSASSTLTFGFTAES